MYISTLILVLVLVISTQADLQRRQGGYPNPSHRSAPLNGPGRRNACGGGALRREWRELSPGERSEFLNAVKCLQRTPSILTNNRGRSGSVYDDFAYTHLFNTPTIHQVAQFLPWHRTYLVFFENALKDFCGFSGSIPYWDWTLDSQAPEQSDVWRTDAFGGTGGEGGCIFDGAFAFLTTVVGKGNPATCVTRNFDRGSGMRGSVYSPEQIGALLATRAGGFNRFRVGVNVPHAAVHNAIGGDMSNPGPSPNDPIFIVHHAMIDKIWADWQELYPDVGDVFEGNRDEGNPGANDARDSDPISGGTDLSSRSVFPGGLTARNAMWTTGGGWFCYRYSRPPVVRRMVAAPVNITTSALTRRQDKRVTTSLIEEAGAQGVSCDTLTAMSNGTLADVGIFRYCLRGAKGVDGSVLTPRASDRTDLFALRKATPLDEGWLRKHGYDVEAVREIEEMFAKVVEHANGVPGYVSRAALGRRILMEGVVTGEDKLTGDVAKGGVGGLVGALAAVGGGGWTAGGQQMTKSVKEMTERQGEAVRDLEMALAAEALGSNGV